MKNILEKTAFQLRDMIVGGQITSVQATQAILDAIEKYDEQIKAYLCIFKEKALADAAKVDAKIKAGEPVGSLGGVPVAVKDNMCSDWATTSCASKMLAGFKAPYNATAVQKLIDADAVIVGKLNMDEFSMGSSSENSGFFTTANPWDASRVSGGSGGSAAAVAARMCFASLGSDTGGSIRQPASFCGIVGLKPSYGRVSRYGLVAYGSSLEQIGPHCQDVRDAALMMNVISGYDKKDGTSAPESMAPVKDYLAELDKPLEGLRVAVVPEFMEKASDDVRKAIASGASVYKSLGAEIVEVQMPSLDYALGAYYIIAAAEGASNLARFDGVHYGCRSKDINSYIDVYTKSRGQGFGQEVKRRIILGTFFLSDGCHDAYYLKALKVRSLICDDFKSVFQKADCLLTPVSPTAAFRVGEKIANPLEMCLADSYTAAMNLAGLPAISIPCGFDSDNMPIGLHITTEQFTEDKLLRIARMFEANTDYSSKKPSMA